MTTQLEFIANTTLKHNTTRNIMSSPIVSQPTVIHASPAEKRVARSLAAMLPPPNKSKKGKKPLEGLAGCKNIWKEPPAHVAWAYNPALWEKENKLEA